MSALPSASGSARRRYLDWLRGVAVLIMIEAHTMDSWTRVADRQTTPFGYAMILGGFGAPMFLFLAGVAIVLAGSARTRRGLTVEQAAAAGQRRGWEIFGYAFLFRLQAWALAFGAPLAGILKVDILNVMGLAMVGAAAIWGRARRTRSRLFWLAAAAATLTLLTPIIRTTEWLSFLPDPIESYLRPQPGRTTFTLFPWAGFLFAGACLGVCLDTWRDAVSDRRLQLALLIAGVAMAVGGYALSYLPSIYSHSNFWTSSPTFFLLRTGLLVLTVPLAWAWERRPWRRSWSPMEIFGTSSLFVYWIHVEMVYGIVSTPLHKTLPLAKAVEAFAVFTLFLFALTLIKIQVVERWKTRRRTVAAVSPS